MGTIDERMAPLLERPTATTGAMLEPDTTAWLGNGAPPALHGDRRRMPRPLVGLPIGPVEPKGIQVDLVPGANSPVRDTASLERAWQQIAELEREVAKLRARLEIEMGERRLTIRERVTGRRRPPRGHP